VQFRTDLCYLSAKVLNRGASKIQIPISASRINTISPRPVGSASHLNFEAEDTHDSDLNQGGGLDLDFSPC